MTLDENLSALLSSSSLILVGVVLSAVAKLVERVVIARAFDPGAYGEVSLGLAIMSIGVTVSLAGFNHGVPRYISRFSDERDIRGAWLTGLAFSVGAALLVTVVLYLNTETLVRFLFDRAGASRLVELFVLVIPLSTGLTIGLSALRGMENTRYKIYAKDLLYPALRIVLLVGLLWLGVGLLAAGYAYLVAAVVAFLVAHLFFRRLFPLVGPVRFHFRDLLAFSAPLVASSILGVLLTKTDTVLLGYFSTSFDVGLYSAAYPLATSLLLILSSFGYLYLPLTSRLDADGEHDQIDAIYSITTKWIFVLTFPAFLAFTVFPGDVLSIMFGAQYRAAGAALAVLSVGFFTSAAAGRNRETLSALGYTEYILGVDALAFASNIVLNVALIPPFGIVGAAVASTVAYVARNLLLNAVLYLKFDITPLSEHTIRTFLVLPAFLVPPVVLVGRTLSLSLVTLPVFLVASGLVALVVVFATGCLQPEDTVPLDLFETTTGVEIPLVRRYIPTPADGSG